MRFDFPSWVSRIANNGNKLSASNINSFDDSRREQKIRSAQGLLIPQHYGRNRVTNKQDFMVMPFDDGPNKVYAVVWGGGGEYEEIEAIYIDDVLSTDYAGVTVTNYLGTDTQTADPTLVAGITGYNDDLKGIVYSVISIPSGTIDNAPRISCTLKGLKVYDPRDAQIKYTTNPALCLADFISNANYGEGKTVVGVEDSADFNDELINGLKRCEFGLEIKLPRKSREWSLLIAEYAECFIIEEGDDVRIRPDKAEASQKTLTDDDIENIQVNVGSTGNAPTVVDLAYLKPSGTSAAWSSLIARRSFPGVGDTIQEIISPPKLLGVFREEEALRKAESRLRRAQLAASYTYEGWDSEVLTQVGDVFTINSDRLKLVQDVRITGVQLIGPGRYRVAASRYDDYAYPDSAEPPASSGVIHDGFILPMLSGSTPAGWSAFNSANGSYLKGSNGKSGIGDTGGLSTIGISGTTTTNGLHTGSGVFRVRLSSQPDVIENYPTGSEILADGAHSHNYADSLVGITPFTRESKLIIRNGGSTSFIPNNAGVFSNGDINSPDVDQVTGFIGRVFKAAADWANTGAQSTVHQITTTAAGAHNHGASGDTSIPATPGSNFAFLDAPNHQHQLTLTLTPNMLRHRLYLYSGAEDYTVQPGMIVATESTGDFAGWVDCDGLNDTPDLVGKYIEMASAINVDTTAGDNTVTITGVTDAKGAHTHQGGKLSSGADPFENVLTNHNDSAGQHTHTASTSSSYEAPYYNLRFLMYTGT